MAGNMISNTFTTYSAKGVREDLTDTIWNVDPVETPFVTAIQKAKCTAPLHEWQTDSLAAAATNAFVQGDDVATFTAVDATTRLGNRTQISRKEFLISGTQEVVLKAGRKSEIAMQLVKKGKELRRDVEYNMLAVNQAAVAASSGTAPRAASVMSWIKTNTSKDAGGSDPSTADGAGTRSDSSTLRTYVESYLKTVLAAIWAASGDQPDSIFVPGTLKQTMSTFSGNTNRYLDAAGKALITSIEVYESDFSSIKVVPCRQQRARDVFVINTDLWAVAFLRPVMMKELAVTGDAEKRLLITEWTLEARNEKGNGGIFDLTT